MGVYLIARHGNKRRNECVVHTTPAPKKKDLDELVCKIKEFAKKNV